MLKVELVIPTAVLRSICKAGLSGGIYLNSITWVPRSILFGLEKQWVARSNLFGRVFFPLLQSPKLKRKVILNGKK